MNIKQIKLIKIKKNWCLADNSQETGNEHKTKLNSLNCQSQIN